MSEHNASLLKSIVLYEDSDFLILNKPSGILSIPDRFDLEKVNLASMLIQNYESILPVHRLDKDTSGTIIFAKNAETHRVLNEKFENRDIDKRYHAICEGLPPEDSGIINAPISHSHTKSGLMTIHPKGKESITKFKLIQNWKKFSLLECKPETGRTHQIRLHLSYIGCPIIGDPFYGNIQTINIHDLKRHSKLSKNEENFKPILQRTALHSYSISFAYNSKKYSFEAPYPKDMKALIYQLNKTN
ncbi:MAG: RluA family pseudouridine synthase [Saprospiraceae bacterium]|nr:RluA family pseudouridine synthase [Saprospiraceae bacterium]